MTILVTSKNPLGLRALGSGGRTVMASYDQIARTLRQQLGEDHAALFTEPSQRPGTIDWFANIDTADRSPVRLNDAESGRRERGRARLEALVRDIESKTVALQRSDRQDERILGDMLAFALNIPDETAVFLVGEHPVLTFWGHVRDLGQPATNPLHALIQRAAARTPDAPLREAATEAGGGAVLASGHPRAMAGQGWPGAMSSGLVTPALWCALALLLVIIGAELLGSCAISLPAPLTGLLINYCPATGPGVEALAAERAQQASLQAEYEEIVRQSELKRQACRITTDRPPSPVPHPIPGPIHEAGPSLQIPPKPADKSFLEGCWKAHEGLTEVHDGKDTGKKLDETFCFNKDGSGDRTIRYLEDNTRCRGTATARLNGDKLIVDLGRAPCDGDHGNFSPAQDTCSRDSTGTTKCDEIDPTDNSKNFSDFLFTRVIEQP